MYQNQAERNIYMDKVWNYNYDYASCMVMKLGMAVPDKENPGKSKVSLTFRDPLDYKEN